MIASRRHVCYALLALALLLALLIRIVPLTYSHFWDETVFLQNARVILDGRDNYDELRYRPPLLSLLYAFAFAIWDNIYVANLAQGIVSTLTVVFVFLFVRPVFGFAAAVFSGLLIAFTPYFAEASHQLLTDAPAVALMLAAMWLFDRPGARNACLAGIVYALAIQTRFTSLFLIVYFVLDTAFFPGKVRKFAILLGAAAAAMTPYLVWAQLQFGSFYFPFAHARRIVTEWTAPVPAGFYWDALVQVFPRSMWVFFGAGVLLPVARWAMARRAGEPRPALATFAALSDQGRRRIVLLLWGAAFLVYMLSIPHKEVRYLLPMVIPVAIVSALCLADLFRWCARQAGPVKVAALLLGIGVAAVDYAPSLQKLARPWLDRSLVEPWVGRSEWEAVQIGRYLHEISAPADTIYAAHNFPVFAYYSERRTVSLLEIQGNFDQRWREVMNRPGFLVYYLPAGIKETHSIVPVFKPDRGFIESRPEFHLLRAFPGALVYRYDLSPSKS